MPHSGGGGSHSGGSHSSSSSHSSSGGGGGHFVKTSNSYFPGARSFFYYRNNAPVFIYSDSDLIKNEKMEKLRYLILLFYIPFIIAIVSMFAGSINIPRKIKGTDSYEIVIEDSVKALGDTRILTHSMSKFKEKTGITPAVITVENEKWKDNYSSLEKYAYDLYVNHFPDETRFLIVYSEPKESDDNFLDWHYELMEGDETYHILTDNANDRINANLTKYFTADSRYSKAEALRQMFVEETETIMKPHIVWAQIGISMVFVLFIGIHMFFMVFFKSHKDYKSEELQEVKTQNGEKPEIAKCEYCKGLYVVGTDLQCPHCGAPVPKY